MDATSLFPSQNLKWFVVLLKTMPLVLRLPNQITRSAPGPNIFQYVCSIFAITSKRGSSQSSMSHQNISLLIFLQNLCPVINTGAYAIKLCGGRQLQLLATRECEVMLDHHLNISHFCSHPPNIVRAILYCLQYLQSFPPIIHLFYLTQFYLPYIFISNIQPESPIYLRYPIRHQNTTKFNAVNL